MMAGKSNSACEGIEVAVWSFNRQGPFYGLQRRLGLFADSDLAAPGRALLFALLAWIPTVLLALTEGNAWGDHYEHAVLLDFSAYAFAIAIAAFVLMEATSDRRMAHLVGQFQRTGVAIEAARPCFTRVRESLERRTGSWPLELGLAVLSFVLAFLWIQAGVERVPAGTWFGGLEGGGLHLTLAGWWTLAIALPLFWFLLLRWLWRFVAWGLLLRDIARCDLRLVATHPAGCGGLAFIGQYPKTYVLFVFALSTVVSATTFRQVVFAGASQFSFKLALLGMIVFLIAAFALPLFFSRPFWSGYSGRA